MKTVVHVNQHVIKANRKNGTSEPCLTVKTYKTNQYANDAIIYGKDGEEINSIFQTLEGTIDSYYDRQSEAKSNKNVSEICADTSYATPEITTSKVIITPDEYDTTKYEEFVHDSECC